MNAIEQNVVALEKPNLSRPLKKLDYEPTASVPPKRVRHSVLDSWKNMYIDGIPPLSTPVSKLNNDILSFVRSAEDDLLKFPHTHDGQKGSPRTVALNQKIDAYMQSKDWNVVTLDTPITKKNPSGKTFEEYFANPNYVRPIIDGKPKRGKATGGVAVDRTYSRERPDGTLEYVRIQTVTTQGTRTPGGLASCRTSVHRSSCN